jgi:NDP-hexose C3-ketoreductase / dTDP-4-oxo-2-deoxy-alpha-D-pentos-2-ene 2,3-reductase
MNFGPATSEADAFAIMDRALEAGIDFFDTANVYGKKPGEGVTERIVGRWLAQGGGRRERVVLATKVFGKMGEGPNDSRLSALHVRRACDESLRRLQTDRIDLYQMHHVWRDVTWDEVWEAMGRLVAEGKVTYVGTSNFAAWNVAQAAETARARHLLGPVSEQSLYNLLQRTVELEVLPACRAYGLGVLPWSPLAEGILAGGAGGVRRESESAKRKREAHRTQLEAFERFCRERGEEPANVALAWLLHQPGVTAPILGPRTLAQLVGALRAAEIRLTAEDLAALDKLFPGPGGQAPEAYAW